jgi:hypothetical protein
MAAKLPRVGGRAVLQPTDLRAANFNLFIEGRRDGMALVQANERGREIE